MTSAIYDTVSAEITVNSYVFKANGQTLKFKGFMTLYVESEDTVKGNEKNKKNQVEENNIPELSVGEEVIKNKIEAKQSFTEPPPRYTEASLVKAFKEKKIENQVHILLQLQLF